MCIVNAASATTAGAAASADGAGSIDLRAGSASDTSTALGDVQGRGPLALVYRGPLSCPGCSEAAAKLVKKSAFDFTVKYIGPREKLALTYRNLSKAALYVQPGGDVPVDDAPKYLSKSQKDGIRKFIRRGGRYLGICQGAYLAGRPGLGMLTPGDTGQYIATKNASVHNDKDSVIPVDWLGQRRMIFFQDGPFIRPPGRASDHILARYTNGKVAAMTTSYGKGTLGLVGPHPEATRSWYNKKLWKQQTDGIDPGPGLQLIAATMS